jgi:hypothetical protein
MLTEGKVLHGEHMLSSESGAGGAQEDQKHADHDGSKIA